MICLGLEINYTKNLYMQGLKGEAKINIFLSILNSITAK